MRKVALKWEIGGFLWILLAGTMMHFVFEWSGSWRPLALIAPVNESVWEHLKMSFWPGLGYGLLEYFSIGRRVNNLWIAKSGSLFTMSAAIVGLYYGYVAVLGHHTLPLDIVVFVVAVALGQWLSFGLMVKAPLPKLASSVALVGLVIMVVAFSTLSFFPPHISLFENPITGGYGIP